VAIKLLRRAVYARRIVERVIWRFAALVYGEMITTFMLHGVSVSVRGRA
jgi:hypothetical protein